MDDYLAAFKARAVDAHALHRKRQMVGSVHFGSFAIECLLKAIIFEQYGISEWRTDRNGHRVRHEHRNPGHLLIDALDMTELRIMASPELLDHFRVLQKPNTISYLNMRYRGKDAISTEDYEKWYKSYCEVRKWIWTRRNF